jgi:hypothetical protein
MNLREIMQTIRPFSGIIKKIFRHLLSSQTQVIFGDQVGAYV